jgi:hypothetical protein
MDTWVIYIPHTAMTDRGCNAARGIRMFGPDAVGHVCFSVPVQLRRAA